MPFPLLALSVLLASAFSSVRRFARPLDFIPLSGPARGWRFTIHVSHFTVFTTHCLLFTINYSLSLLAIHVSLL